MARPKGSRTTRDDAETSFIPLTVAEPRIPCILNLPKNELSSIILSANIIEMEIKYIIYI